MDFKGLANLAGEVIAAAKDVSPRKCLDKIRRHLMFFMCAEDKFELTGTIEDFGGKERRTADLVKLVFACFEFAAVLKVDLAGVLEERFGGAKAAADEKPTLGQKPPSQETASVKEGSAPQPQPEAVASASKETASAGTGDVQHPQESGHAPGDKQSQGKEELLAMYRKFFAEATSLELVENTWKKELSAHKTLDGKDKGALFKDYAEAKKRLGGK